MSVLEEQISNTADAARVLVADDNAEMREFVRRLLADQYRVEVVADGQAALDAARRARPALLITDLVMPGMDGLALVKAVRSDPSLRTIPVLVLTERGELDARVEGLEAGADDYLNKPFSPRELRARVRTSLELARMREFAERAAGREEALLESNRRKDEFLSMLAHELRNPLAPLGYGIDLLAMPNVRPEKQARAREMIGRQVAHLTRIVDDLLDVSRLRTGKLTVTLDRLDLSALVRHVVEDWRGAVEAQRISISLDFPAGPVWIMGDVTRLAQLLHNLLDNARKFTPPGGRVSVSVAANRDIGLALVRVRDTGAGIDAALLPRVFEVFAQAEQSLDRTRGGLGLGLAVVKGLVELHQGTIEAASDGVGKGAEFTVRLPVLAEKPAVAVPAAPEPAREGKTLRVLIVEDNKDTVDILRSLLEHHGHHVAVAYTGPEGVTAAKAGRPDVVLCDIGLPGMDGYAVATEIRRDPAISAARLIAVTGYGRDSDRTRALQSGFDVHLVKPVNAQQLLGQLATV